VAETSVKAGTSVVDSGLGRSEIDETGGVVKVVGVVKIDVVVGAAETDNAGIRVVVDDGDCEVDRGIGGKGSGEVVEGGGTTVEVSVAL